MGTSTAAERKAAERINRQVAPWRYRAELEHAIGVAAGRALAHGDSISRAELVERTVTLLVQSSNDAARKLLRAHKVRHGFLYSKVRGSGGSNRSGMDRAAPRCDRRCPL
jgi:hypothetical protein